METVTSELSARMNAMENSSKNASDVVAKLTVAFNRSRQAKITTELCEIIGGTVASDDAIKVKKEAAKKNAMVADDAEIDEPI